MFRGGLGFRALGVKVFGALVVWGDHGALGFRGLGQGL